MSTYKHIDEATDIDKALTTAIKAKVEITIQIEDLFEQQAAVEDEIRRIEILMACAIAKDLMSSFT